MSNEGLFLKEKLNCERNKNRLIDILEISKDFEKSVKAYFLRISCFPIKSRQRKQELVEFLDSHQRRNYRTNENFLQTFWASKLLYDCGQEQRGEKIEWETVVGLFNNSEFRNPLSKILNKSEIEHNFGKIAEQIYKIANVGQKVGNLYLNFLFLYGLQTQNKKLKRELLVPVDRHVHRVFCRILFGTNWEENESYIPQPTDSAGKGSGRYDIFQNELKLIADSIKSYRYLFDIFWIIGRMFCGGDKNLDPMCEFCWLNKSCEYSTCC